MIRNIAYRLFVALVLVPLVLAGMSCVSQPARSKSGGQSAAAAELPETKEFSGGGQNESLLEAMRLAKAAAVRQGVIEIIGSQKEKANETKLNEVLYSARSVTAYAEMKGKATRKDKIGEEYVYEALFVVKLRSIEATLKAHGIIETAKTAKDEVVAKVKEEMAPDDEPVAEEEVVVTDADVYTKLSKDEEIFIKKYMDKMSFVVYFSKESADDPKYLRGAVSSANDYLISNGKKAFDLAQVEKLKEDQALVYEEETGESISITQWIAQKLSADVYVELEGTTKGRSEAGNKFYGTANVQMKAYEASTGDLIGSVVYNLLDQKAMYSKVSEDDARLQAIQGVVYSKVMPEIFKQISEKMVENLRKHGIRYEVTIQNPPGDRVMTKLWKKLDKKIKSYDSISQSKKESKYSVYFIGSIDDLKEAFYDAAETVPELEAMEAVMARGKSITFNSGM